MSSIPPKGPPRYRPDYGIRRAEECMWIGLFVASCVLSIAMILHAYGVSCG